MKAAKEQIKPKRPRGDAQFCLTMGTVPLEFVASKIVSERCCSTVGEGGCEILKLETMHFSKQAPWSGTTAAAEN